MVKRIAITAASAALLLASALPAFGYEINGGGGYKKGHLDIAIVQNGSEALANSGSNSQSSDQTNKAKAWKGGEAEVEGGSGDQTIETGDAKAKSKAVVVANTHVGCGCESRKGIDFALVSNGSGALADSGYNTQSSTQYNKAKAWKGGEAEVEGG